jgi:hypothetical protein
MQKIKILFIFISIISISCTQQPDTRLQSNVPDLAMPENGLKFKEIEGYKNYKIVATHYRKDKNELRYILVNEIAFKPFVNNEKLPEGSKIVKIGWKVKEMPNFQVALESDTLQRIEYMIKDAKKFKDNPGHWGYARFVKEKNNYKSWGKGTQSCIDCHNLAKGNDFLFTRYQPLF